VPPTLLLPAASFVLGTIVGSFLNVCIHRLPRGLSLIRPPSHCPSCGAPVRPWDNVPVLSYLLLRGRCRYCRTPISPRYAAVELLTGLLFLLAAYRFGLSPRAALYAVLFAALVVVTFIDLEHGIIPNAVTYPGIAAGLVFNALMTDWRVVLALLARLPHAPLDALAAMVRVTAFDSLLGTLLGGGVLLLVAVVYARLRKREGMGMGDVKLLAMIGAFLGTESILYVLLVSSLAGTVAGAALMAARRKGDGATAIPYGPFLSLGAVLYVLTGGFPIIR